MNILQTQDLSAFGDFGRIMDKIGNQWMLLTAGTMEQANTMTASWGSVGVLWHRPMVNIVVRPERYTYEFIEREEYFTLSFFGEEYREALNFCGVKSGRDVDKFTHCGLTLGAHESGGLVIKEATENFICKRRYRTPITFEQMERDFDPTPYYNEKKGGLHIMYMAEIIARVV